MKILVVEDDLRIASIVKECLCKQNYTVDVVEDGELALTCVDATHYDLLILDWMLPKLDGLAVCKQLRDQGNSTSILMLTARDKSSDKVQGLDVGADDYVVKPFDIPELLARVRALLRRSQIPIASTTLSWGLLEIDTAKHEIVYDQNPISSTPKEYSLVELFVRSGDRILSYDNIIEAVWTFDDSPGKDVVKTHLKSIRQKLKKAGAPADIIENVYGVGYRMNPKY
ncbi:MAG: response regulator transcription factor [Leptolyngbyaceae cyanobacterium]